MPAGINLGTADVRWKGDANGSGQVTLFDADGNVMPRRDRTAFPLTQGGQPIALNDDGVARLMRGDEAGGLLVGQMSPMYHDPFDGATSHGQFWTAASSGMNVVQAMRLLTLNNNATLTGGSYYIYTTIPNFAKTRGNILRFSARLRFSWQVSGAVMELGFGTAATTAAPTNGAFLRVLANGDVKLVLNYNSTETQSATLATIGSGAGQINPAHYYDVDIVFLDDAIKCVVQRSDDSLAGGIAENPVIDARWPFALATATDFAAIATPAFFRIYNSGAVGTASQMLITSVFVGAYDSSVFSKPWPDHMSRSGRSLLMHPATGVQLANYGNSGAPSSASLSNTAAGYTTLGGQWQFAAVGGGETDYAFFGFAVPAGRTLHVAGLNIEAVNTGAAVAGTVTLLQWGIARSTAVTLATNTFRKTIGMQVFPIGAAIGVMATPVTWRPRTPFVVDSAQTFHIILKMPLGTATASQVIRGIIDVDGYFE